MSRRVGHAVALSVLAGLMLSPPTFAGQAEEFQALWQEAKARAEQVKAYRRSRQAEIKQLTDQIVPLRSQLQAAMDPDVRKRLREQLQPLEERRQSLSEDLAEFLVDMARKDLEFAQRRLEAAEASLAQVRARTAPQPPKKATPAAAPKR